MWQLLIFTMGFIVGKCEFKEMCVCVISVRQEVLRTSLKRKEGNVGKTSLVGRRKWIFTISTGRLKVYILLKENLFFFSIF